MNDFESTVRAVIASRAAAGTRQIYTADFDRWLRFCEKQGFDPSAPTLAASTWYRDELAQSLAPLTLRRILSCLSKLYRSAIAQGAASSNPFDADALPRPSAHSYSLTQLLTDEEVKQLVEVAGREPRLGARDVAIMWLLYQTGQRITSITSLKRAHLHLSIPSAARAQVTVKRGKQAEVALPLESVQALDAWLVRAPSSAWVFPAKDPKRPLASRAFNKRLERYGKAAGVHHVHPHRFRSAYITAALDAGVPLQDVQASVQHEDPKTTLRYDRRLRGTQVADAVSRYRKGE